MSEVEYRARVDQKNQQNHCLQKMVEGLLVVRLQVEELQAAGVLTETQAVGAAVSFLQIIRTTWSPSFLGNMYCRRNELEIVRITYQQFFELFLSVTFRS